jgi:hypothetical protein
MGKSMRDDFEEAISDLEDTADTADNTPEPQAEAQEPFTDEISPQGAEAEAPAQETEAFSGEESEPPGKTANTGGTEQPADRAPSSWSPAERVHWKNLPPEVKATIGRREHQINKALNDGADNRKTGEKFKDVVTRYQAVIAAEGVSDPIVGFEQLMQTMSLLRLGSPEQKANLLAGFVGTYGVPIELLDSALAGQPVAQQQDPLDAKLDQRLQPVNELLSQIQQAKQQQTIQTQQAATNDVQQFGQTKEFFNDVRNDMADMIEFAAQRGIEMSLEEAYNKACAVHPEVSRVIAGRQQNMQSKHNAASSIKGNQGGTPQPGQGDNLRAQLEELWDAQTG